MIWFKPISPKPFTRPRWLLPMLASAAAASLAVLIGLSVHAAGIPEAGALTYTGYLENPDGSPVTDRVNVAITLYDGEAGDGLLCNRDVADVTLVAGRFQVVLPDQCTAAVQANPDVWVEVAIDGAPLGRTKLGAVPYAIEAGRASEAGGALKTTVDGLTEDLGVLDAKVSALADGLSTGCDPQSALQSVDEDGVPACIPAIDIVAIEVTYSGGNAGSASEDCPTGYTLLTTAMWKDHRGPWGADGWDNGRTHCYADGNTLTAEIGNYSNGSSFTMVGCVGICVR